MPNRPWASADQFSGVGKPFFWTGQKTFKQFSFPNFNTNYVFFELKISKMSNSWTGQVLSNNCEQKIASVT